ncbi:MAG: SDR family oxidoreductase [Nitrospirae bacterium]|nr:SDR family oxidoreductase [Nitrospirota bacterium]
MSHDSVIITGSNGDIGTSLSSLFRGSGMPVYSFHDDLRLSNSIILHLAAKSPPASCDEMIESNILYLREVVRSAQRYHIENMIFFSAVSAYGDMDMEDLTEEGPYGQPGFYGLTKLIGEQYLKAAGINALCLRLPAVLGFRNKTNIMSRLFLKLVNNEAIELTNHDKLFNNFISIENIFEFIINLRLKHKHDIINLASGKDLTLNDIAALMRILTGSSSTIRVSREKTNFIGISTKKAGEEYNFVPLDAVSVITRWVKQRMAYELEGQHGLL